MKTYSGLPSPFVEPYKLPNPLVIDDIEVTTALVQDLTVTGSTHVNTLQSNKANITEIETPKITVSGATILNTLQSNKANITEIETPKITVSGVTILNTLQSNKANITEIETPKITVSGATVLNTLQANASTLGPVDADTLKSKNLRLTDPTTQLTFDSGTVQIKSSNPAPVFSFIDDHDNYADISGNVFRGKTFQGLQTIDGASLTTQTNQSTGAANVAGFSAINGSGSVDLVMVGSTQTGTVRSSAEAFGLELDARGSNKSIKLSTNSVPRLTIQDSLVSVGDTAITSTTYSTNKNTGALVVSGGVGVAQNVTCAKLVSDTSSVGVADFEQVRLGSTIVTANSLSVNGSIGAVGAINSPSVLLTAPVNNLSATNAATTKQYVDNLVSTSIGNIPPAPVITCTTPIVREGDNLRLKLRPNVVLPFIGAVAGLFVNSNGELEMNTNDVTKGYKGISVINLEEYLGIINPGIPLPFEIPEMSFISVKVDASLGFDSSNRVGVKFQGTHRVPFFNFSDFTSDTSFTFNENSKTLDVKYITVDPITSSSSQTSVVTKKYVDELIRIGSNQPFALITGGTMGLNKDLSLKYNENHFKLNASDELESKIAPANGSCIAMTDSVLDLGIDTNMFTVFDKKLKSRLSAPASEPLVLNSNHELSVTVNTASIVKTGGTLDLSSTVKSDITTLKSDVATLKTDVTTLKADVTALKGDVTVLQGDMVTVKTGVSTAQTTATAAQATAAAAAAEATAAGVVAAGASFTANAAAATAGAANALALTAAGGAATANTAANTANGRINNLDDRIANTFDLNIVTMKKLTVGSTEFPLRLVIDDTAATYTIPVVLTSATASGLIKSLDLQADGKVVCGGFDFILGNFNQTLRGDSGLSRALVKHVGNKLAINFGNDFTGGVEIQSALAVNGSLNMVSGQTFNLPGAMVVGSAATFSVPISAQAITCTSLSTGSLTIASLNNTPIGNTTPSTGVFTTLGAGAVTCSSVQTSGGVTNGGFDFVLGSADQTSRGNSGASRAFVKDAGNVLAINFANDFSGGVEIRSALKISNGLTMVSGQTFTLPGAMVVGSAATFSVPISAQAITCTSLSATSLNNTTIGTTTPSTGVFTTLGAGTISCSGTVTAPTVSTTTLTATNATLTSLAIASTKLRIAASNSDYSVLGTNTVDDANNTRIVLSGYTRSGNPGKIEYIAGPSGTHEFNKSMFVNSLDESTSITTGALTVAGGAGIDGNVYARNLNVTGVTASNITCSGNLTTGSLTLAALNNTPIGSTNPSTGVFTTLTTGSLTCSGTFTVGDLLSTSNRLRIAASTSDYSLLGTNTVDGTSNTRIVISGIDRSANPGCIEYITTGGLGYHIFQTGQAQFLNTTEATNTSFASVTLNGGMGVAKQIYCKKLNTTTDGIVCGGFDFTLGSYDNSSRGNSGASRALVKDAGSTLVMNFAGDYTGGIVLGGPKVRVDGNLNMLAACTSTHNTDVTYAMHNVALTSAKDTFTSFRNSSNVEIGSIYRGGLNTVNYSTTSDYRIKTNVENLQGCLEKVLSVSPRKYSLNNIKEKTQGFIAHEIQTVCPEAVAGYKDEVDENGIPKLQSVDYGKLTTLLWGAIHELKAEICCLKEELKKKK